MAHNEAYYQAERKIEEALQSGATELDLSKEWNADEDSMLTELPELLLQLAPQLHSLNLANNWLTLLPDWLGQLTQLQVLDLNSSHLYGVQESLGELAALTQLHVLYLADNELTELPESLGQLTQLQVLSLAHNELTELPESLGQLTQLKELDLYSNQLTLLPESVGQR